VELKILETGEILIFPQHRKPTLNELVKKITKQNLHQEVQWGEVKKDVEIRKN
jgi:antitoxin component of MazEF toxin-antitoxin module